MDQLVASTVAEDGIGIVLLATLNSSRAAMQTALSGKPEFALLLTIARVKLTSDGQSRLQKLLARPLDWDYLLIMAELHGLETLLFHHLCDCAAVIAPSEVLQRLRDKCRIIALRNLLLSAKLREISAYLTSRKIEHIAYKGPLLAEIYGGNGALRTYRDLDLLVPPTKLEVVRDALLEIGFVDRYGLAEEQQAASFQTGFEHSFTSKSGIDLDIHWRIVQAFKSHAFDMDGIWSRKTVATLLDQAIPALSAEDLLVVLCLHAEHHAWMQLSHMCDLAQLFLVQKKFDWGIVLAHLGDSNTRRIVYVSLHLLERHWNVDIPEEIAARIHMDKHVKRLAHRIEVEIWPAEQPVFTTSSLQWLLNRSAGEDWRDRTRLVAGSIFVPAIEDFALLKLSPALSPLYPALRVLRLAWRFLSSTWHRTAQSEAIQDMAIGEGLQGN